MSLGGSPALHTHLPFLPPLCFCSQSGVEGMSCCELAQAPYRHPCQAQLPGTQNLGQIKMFYPGAGLHLCLAHLPFSRDCVRLLLGW